MKLEARLGSPHPPQVPREDRGQRGGIIFKLIVIFTLVLVLGVIYLLRRPLLREAGQLLIADESLQPADAIIVIGDDNYPADRAARAAQLYRERWAPRVVASGRYLRPYATVAELIRRDLMERGVPADAIVPFPHRAANTREEAMALRLLVRQQRWRRVIVVTSSFHTRRTRYLFRGLLDPETQVRVVAASDSSFDPASWWESREGLKIFLRESLAWPVAVWEMNRSDKSDAQATKLAPAPKPN